MILLYENASRQTVIVVNDRIRRERDGVKKETRLIIRKLLRNYIASRITALKRLVGR